MVRSGQLRGSGSAERALSRIRTEPAGFFSPWNAAHLLMARGKTALSLGRLHEAIDLFDRALTAATGWMLPFYEILTAAVLAQTGESERAVTLLTNALNGTPAGTTMIEVRARTIVEEYLAGYDESAVRMLRDRLGR
jgi:predicted Zn-dependent protease